MGVGKSTTGRALADRLDLAFRDSDRDLETLFDGPGATLVENHGVDTLHELERAVVLGALAGNTPTVIAAAASVVEDALVREAITSRSSAVLLEAPLELVLARQAGGSHRRTMDLDELRTVTERRAAHHDALEPLRVDATLATDDIVDLIATHLADDDGPVPDDPLSPPVEDRVELDRYALSTLIYAERPDGTILLMQRAEGTAMAGQYFMPGGIVDPGETPHEAAVRELREESGLEFDGPMTMVGCYPLWVYGQDFLQLSFRGSVSGEVVQSHEHTDHRWVDPAEMVELFSPAAIAALAGDDARIADLLDRIGEDLHRYLALRRS
jgi:8-oxo-dGTP diphosphatase